MPDIYLDVDTALSEVPVNIFPLTDDTDFKTRETAVAYNAAGMDLVWNFVTSAGAFTQTAVTPTTAGTYDWTHQGDGMYTIEIPASGGASINNDTEGYGWFTGVATGVLPWRGPILGFRHSAINDSLCDTNTTGILAPTTAGRTLDVTATGEAGIDWANIGSPTTTVNLSGTTVKTATDVETDTADIQTRLPAALVGGRIDANMGAISADSVAADNAESFFDGTGYAGTNNVIPTVTTVNGLAAGVITAAAIATGAIDADALAADAVAEIADGVLDEALSGHTTAGTLGKAIADIEVDTSTTLQAELDGIQADTEDIQARLPAALVGGRIDANVGAISADSVAADNCEAFFDGTGYAGTGNTIPTVTTVSAVTTVNGLANNVITATALDATAVAEIADGVWDEVLSGHQTVGTTGRSLTLAGTIIDETTSTGTPTTTTLQLTAGSTTDDFYNDLEIIITSGTLAGQARVITDYTGATRTVTIDEAWTSAPASGVNVLIRARHSHSINQIADAVWDEALTAGTHNIANSAGRRLRTLQTGGNYEGGMVWVDTVNGVAGTTVDENGVVTNPVLTWADAVTIAAGVPLKAFHIANGTTITLSASATNYTLTGHEWNLALNGQSVAEMMVIDASVSGTGTGAESEYVDCIFGITSLPAMQAYNCSFTATTSGGFTMSAAGDYRFINCQSGIAGMGAPLFTLGTGAITAEFRRWSGGIQIANISSDDVLTIGGELGTVTLSGADGTVEIRGSYKAIVDNRTGSPTLNLDGAFKGADVATILADTNELQTDWANGGRLDNILDARASQTSVDDIPTVAEFEARTPTAAQLAYIVNNAQTGLPVTFTTSGGSTTAAVLNTVDGGSPSATNDQYNGRLLVFTDGTLKGVVTDITDYVGSTTTATITAIPTAPTSSHNARLI